MKKTNNPALINQPLGRTFFLGAVIFGVAFIPFGIWIMYIQSVWIGLPLSLLGGFLALSHDGIQFNTEEKLYKEYTVVYGIKLGKWKSYEKFLDLVVLRKKQRYGANQMVDYSIIIETEGYAEIIYELYLVSANHLQRIFLQEWKDRDKAFETARKFAEDLHVDLVRYNPSGKRPRMYL